MGGTTMLSYWKQFEKDSRLAGLGLAGKFNKSVIDFAQHIK